MLRQIGARKYSRGLLLCLLFHGLRLQLSWLPFDGKLLVRHLIDVRMFEQFVLPVGSLLNRP